MVHELGDRGSGPAGDPQGVVWNPDAVRRRWEGREGSSPCEEGVPEVLRLSRKYVGRRVLDVGAGAGALIRRLPGAIGLDLAPRGPGVLRGDISRMPFTSESFDTAFAIEVLEHLPGGDLERGLREIRRVLKPGGRLVVATPWREDLARHGTVCPQCGARFHWLGHVWSFDEASLGAHLRNAGLDVLEVRVVPIGFRGRHRIVGRFSPLLARLGFTISLNLFAVSRRPL